MGTETEIIFSLGVEGKVKKAKEITGDSKSQLRYYDKDIVKVHQLKNKDAISKFNDLVSEGINTIMFYYGYY